MQSYGDFQQIPRNFANSSSTCVDNGPNFGQIEETGQKVVQTIVFPQLFGSLRNNSYLCNQNKS